MQNFTIMGNYNCVRVCKGQGNWPPEGNADTIKKAYNVSPELDEDQVSIVLEDITDEVSQHVPYEPLQYHVPYPEQATNEHNDDDKPETKEHTDANDKSQASLGSKCSSVLVPPEEENPENINTHNQ